MGGNTNGSKSTTVVVTGGAGLIGKPICIRLLELGHKVICVDDFSNSDRTDLPKDLIVHECNLVDADKTKQIIVQTKPEIIFHLACHPYEGLSQFIPYDVSQTTYIATVNVVVGAIAAGTVKRIVNFSSMARYGKGHVKDDGTLLGPPFQEWYRPSPKDVYAVAKIASEHVVEIMCNLHHIEWVHCVPHNVYGEANKMALSDPYRGFILIWINCLLRDKPFYIYGDGMQKRAPTYIGDVVDPMVQLGFSDKVKYQTINIGALKDYTLNELAEIVCRVFEEETKRKAKKPIHTEARPCEVKHAWCCIDKSKELLGYKDITSVEEGVRKVVRWAVKIAPNGLPPRYLKEYEISKKAPKTWTERLI